MLLITVPNTYELERYYIISVIFGEFFGINYRIVKTEQRDIRITADDDQVLIISDGLFAIPKKYWLTESSLPKYPIKIWNLNLIPLEINLKNKYLPVIYGEPLWEEINNINGKTIKIGLDIFGSAFFMLTRYEEVVKSSLDKHQRFPAIASLAYREGFLQRPIINEYLEILFSSMRRLWPGLKRIQRTYQIYLSHDVDSPLKCFTSNFSHLARMVIGDIVKRKNIKKGILSISDWLNVKAGTYNYLIDPYNNFREIMNISEDNNLKSAFYFITQHTSKSYDGIYSIHNSWVRELMREIYQRGHEIGLHTSYNTYKSSLQTRHEFALLRKVCLEENIWQKKWGGRQHYLRWEAPTTWQNWEDAGLNYDSSLCYADYPGFRCGVCYEYSVFNLLTRKHLNLIERPLIVMDCSLIGDAYNNVTTEEAWEQISKLKEQCRFFNGIFTLLWHNTELITTENKVLYKSLIT